MTTQTLTVDTAKTAAIRNEIVKAILSRLDSQYPKNGKARDKAALELICGAAIAAEHAGVSLTGLAFIVSVRGAKELKAVAA